MEGFVVFLIIIGIAVFGKVKEAIKKEAKRANEYAEQMKKMHDNRGGDNQNIPAVRQGPAPGGAGSLQNLLTTLAAQAGQPQVVQPKPAPKPVAVQKKPQPKPKQGQGSNVRMHLTGESAAVPVEESSKQKKSGKKQADKQDKPYGIPAIPAMAAIAPIAPIAGGPLQAVYPTERFLERLNKRSPWHAAIVLQEVLGKPRAVNPFGENTKGF